MKDTVIKKIAKRFLEEIPDQNFLFRKNVIYKFPINDILLGFCFEKSGFNKDGGYVSVFAQPLYVKSDSITLSFGKRLKGINGELWQLDNNPNLENTINELLSLMKNSVQDYLRYIDEVVKFYNYYHDKTSNIRMIQAITYSAIYSNISDSEIILDSYIDTLQKQDLSIKWIKNLLEESLYLKSIFFDKEAINRLFINNREATLKSIGL